MDIVQFLLSGLVVGSIYGLIGVGFTFIFNVTGIVNFAQGDFAMIGAMSAITLIGAGLPLPLAVVLAVIVTSFVAAVIERLAIRPVRQDVVRGIIVTIGLGVMIHGVAVLLWGTDAYPMPAFSGETPIAILGSTVTPQALWVFGTAVVIMVLLELFFRRTFIGQMFRACAVNPFAAQLVGIRIGTMSLVSFVMSGALGAVAGIVAAPITLTQYDTGLTLGIKGFIACIIGGFGSPVGAAVGGLTLGVLEALAAGYVSSGYKNAIAFVLLLIFLLFRPGGLFGEFEKARV